MKILSISRRARCTSAFVGAAVLLSASAASAQIISSAASNDMDPSYTADGWLNTVGSYDAIPTNSNFFGHIWLAPPDGNSYGGGTQYSGVPGTQETIAKTIPGLTSGTSYVVEWYIMADRVQGTSTEEVWFDVNFCGVKQETTHIQYAQSRVWMNESRVFMANSTSCSLSFTARNPSGNNSNWIFLDSVQVAVANPTDFSIAVTGPATVPTQGIAAQTVNVTVGNIGPTDGTPPVVTYPLPNAVSVLGGAAGSVPATGADGANWGCTANATVPQKITCTRNAFVAVGSSVMFSLAVDFGASAAGTMRTSTLTVAPTFQQGNFDPVLANNTASFVTTTVAAVCGNGILEPTETCDDGNTMPGDGCNATCILETGFVCPMPGMMCMDIDECSDETDDCDANASCENTVGSYNCICNSGYTGNGFTCTDIDECVLGTDNCSPNGTCTNLPGTFSCACNSGYTGTGVICMDIDECVAGTDNCNANANCTNMPGTFECNCNSGYIGNGIICDDIDECVMGTANCATNASCINTPGSFVCDCTTGYEGDGTMCTDIDECAKGTDNCDPNATCTNTPGSFTCMCNTGTTGDGTKCEAVCGDGVIGGSETCDDGNTKSGDGCHAMCVIEDGWTCGGTPSMCLPGKCGDGVLLGVEGCDDGNTTAGDGCSATCAVEDGWVCQGLPSQCTNPCADQKCAPPNDPTQEGGCACTVVGDDKRSVGASMSAWLLAFAWIVRRRASKR